MLPQLVRPFLSISNLNQIFLLSKGGFYQFPPNNQTHWSIFTLKRNFSYKNRVQVNNFLKAVKSKGQKFYIIAFLTFLSQHFDQERVSFFKTRECKRSIFTLVQSSSYKTCCVWQCDFGVKHFYLLMFSYLILFLVAFALVTFSAQNVFD